MDRRSYNLLKQGQSSELRPVIRSIAVGLHGFEPALAGLAGLYAGQAPRERVLILLSLLGAARQVALPAADVVAVR